mmetsp:Transcript_6264/g.22928  ORF Transcript_6264/g.22928 Transcript_6264/m.22928 type:complete len:243 (-) Transcript_6264:476-1204(-)
MSRDDTHVRSFRLRRRRRLLRSFVRSRAPSHFSRHSSPSAAFEFAVPLASSASCAAATLAASPLHAFKTLDCNARPYENDSAHGFTAGSLFIAFRCAVASSSLCPPDRNRIPGTAGGTTRCSARTVSRATSSVDAPPSPASAPAVAMLGLRIVPSSITPWSLRDLNTAARTRSVTAADVSTSCAPSVKISGSTIGTRPFFWQIDAYRASASAFARTHKSLGLPLALSIDNTARHFANRAPRA